MDQGHVCIFEQLIKNVNLFVSLEHDIVNHILWKQKRKTADGRTDGHVGGRNYLSFKKTLDLNIINCPFTPSFILRWDKQVKK